MEVQTDFLYADIKEGCSWKSHLVSKPRTRMKAP